MHESFVTHFAEKLNRDQRSRVLVVNGSRAANYRALGHAVELKFYDDSQGELSWLSEERFDGLILGPDAFGRARLVEKLLDQCNPHAIIGVHSPNPLWYPNLLTSLGILHSPRHAPSAAPSTIEFLAYKYRLSAKSFLNLTGAVDDDCVADRSREELDLGSVAVRARPGSLDEVFEVREFFAVLQRTLDVDPGVLPVSIFCHQADQALINQCVSSLLADKWFEFQIALFGVESRIVQSIKSEVASTCNAKILDNMTQLFDWCEHVSSCGAVLFLDVTQQICLGGISLLRQAVLDRPINTVVQPTVCSPSLAAISKASMDHEDWSRVAWTHLGNVRLHEIDSLTRQPLLVRSRIAQRALREIETSETCCLHSLADAMFRCRSSSDVFLEAIGVSARTHGKPKPPSAEEVLSPSSHKVSRPDRPLISLCMIVRDNESTIRECLESIFTWVDEIVIVDTGSTDRTMDICREYCAVLHEFPWRDDFSAARNESLKLATGEWIFWMDSDDVMPAEQGKRLRELACQSHSERIFGYVLQVHCPSEESRLSTIVDQIKLFRNLPELRFEHRIHEQILPSIRALNGVVEFTDIYVVHYGSIQSPSQRQVKQARDLRILKLDLDERPQHPFVLFNLGMTHEHAGNTDEAIGYLRRCIAVSGTHESHLPKAWALLVSCWQQKNAVTAIRVATEALQVFPTDPELLFRRGVAKQTVGSFDDAIIDYEQILAGPVTACFRSIDPSILGCKTLHNLAVCYYSVGRQQDALRCYLQSTASIPTIDASWLAAAELLLHHNDIAGLQELVTRSHSAACGLRSSTQEVLNAFHAEILGNVPNARDIMAGICSSSQDIDLHIKHCNLLSRCGDLEREIQILSELVASGCSFLEQRLAARVARL